MEPKPEGVVADAAGAVVGNGTCPQFVARFEISRPEIGWALGIEAIGAVPAELVKGGTENGWGVATVVEGKVVPLVAPCAEAAGAMGRPARSTF